MKIAVTDWIKYHRFQEKPGWCGPAVIQTALLASGIEVSQKVIAKHVYKDWWGSTQQIVFAYLSKYFGGIHFTQNASLSDISHHLDSGHVIIVNWWDDLDKNDKPGGHYSIIGDYDHKSQTVTLIDPSNSRTGIVLLPEKEFTKKWFDTLDVHDKTRVESWMLWLDRDTIL